MADTDAAVCLDCSLSPSKATRSRHEVGGIFGHKDEDRFTGLPYVQFVQGVVNKKRHNPVSKNGKFMSPSQ
jgi:hypothetical protein